MATKSSNEKQIVGAPIMSLQKAQSNAPVAVIQLRDAPQSPDKRPLNLIKQGSVNIPGDSSLNSYIKQNELPPSNTPQQRNQGLIQTQQPQQNTGPTRMLLLPQTYHEHQKVFTIDKQEYQSVFRIIDKDNQGHITIEQVNSYLDKFEQLHQKQVKGECQETITKPKQTQQNIKNSAQHGYQRVRVTNGPTPIKTNKQSLQGQNQQVVGSHLINSAEPLSANSINVNGQKSQERNQQRRLNQQQIVDSKQVNKVTTNLSNSTSNQTQSNPNPNSNQTSKQVAGTPILAQNKINQNSQKTPTQIRDTGSNAINAQHSNSYGLQPTTVGGQKPQTERVQKWNEISGAPSNITTASTQNKPAINGLSASKTSFKLQNGESPQKRPSQSGMDSQQQKPDSASTGSGLQLRLVQVNSPVLRTNVSHTSSATETANLNQAQNQQQTIDSQAIKKFPNGKPTLEFDEFIEVIRESCTDPKGAENYLIHAFSMFDIEKKGFINSKDLKLVFELLDESVTDEELTTMIKIASLKSSDRINFKAFVDFFYKAD